MHLTYQSEAGAIILRRTAEGVVIMLPDDVPAENVLNMAVVQFDGEVEPQNDIYFHSDTGAMDAARGKVICQAVYDWYGSQVMPLLGGDTKLVDCIGVDMTGSPHFLANANPRADVPGSDTACLPLVLSLRVDFRSGLTGPWFNGRNFVPGIPESKCVKSHVDAAWAESVRTAYEGLFAVAASVDCTWVVVSRRFAGAVRSSAVVTPIASVVIPDLRVRTYRQRIARFGT